MDVEEMLRRCPGARLLGTARLDGHRFLIGSRGFATVVPDSGSRVYGVLWALDADGESALDEYEGVARGLYQKVTLAVVGLHAAVAEQAGDTPGKRGRVRRRVEALLYVACDESPGRPPVAYLGRIIRSAGASGFPPDYVAELRRWCSLEVPD
jgi:gamma-glutamylcyclotransferase (GGCT)/AIG2-like uncharacterized protein YtfP